MRVDSQPIQNNIPTTTSANFPKAPWKMGDPSSFQDLFTDNIAPVASSQPPSTAQTVAAPINAAPPAVTAQAAAPVVMPTDNLPAPTFAEGATVTGPGGDVTGMNPMELASLSTAQALATKLGGTVTPETFAGGYATSAPVLDITFAKSNVKINAGIASSLFSQYGDAQNSLAWQTINSDLGRDLSATEPVS